MNKIHKWNGRQQFDFIRNILKIGHFSIWITLYLTENVIKWLTIDIFRKKWTDWCLILHEMQHVLQHQKKSFQFREIKKIHNSFFPPEKNKPKHFSLFLMIIDEWWPFFNLSKGISNYWVICHVTISYMGKKTQKNLNWKSLQVNMIKKK